MSEPELVDWDLAVATGRRLVRPGPQLTRAEADEVVADLRRLAVEAEAPRRRLHAPHPAGRGAAGGRRRPQGVVAVQRRRPPLGDLAAARQARVEPGQQRGFSAASVAASPACRSAVRWPSSRARCSASSRCSCHPTRSPGRAAGCRWSRRTSPRSSARSARCRATSGCGSACTSRRTGCSSTPSPGSAGTWRARSPRSSTRPTWTRPPSPAGSRTRSPRCGATTAPAWSRRCRRPSSGRSWTGCRR